MGVRRLHYWGTIRNASRACARSLSACSKSMSMSSKKKFEETTLPPVPAKKVKITVTNSLSLTTRKKTGGRVRLTLEQKLELAAQRSKIASFHDDTTLEPELAALYLGISEKKLEELRRATTNARHHTSHRIPFYKIFDHDALGQNQPIQYKLGDLRYFHREIRVTDSHEAAVNAGLASWVFVKRPYFIKLEMDGSRSIIDDAWNLSSRLDSDREQNLLDFIFGKIEIKFYTPAQAGLQLWNNSYNQMIHNGRVEFDFNERLRALNASIKKNKEYFLKRLS